MSFMKVKKIYFLIPLILLLLITSIYAEEPEKSVNQNELQEIKNGLKELENKFHKLDKELTRQETDNEGNQKRLEGLINKLPDVS